VFIAPVEELMDNPGEELYVPPDDPDLVTGTLPMPVHRGVPPYEIVAEGAWLTITVVVTGTAGHPPVGGIV
jgi:hypothetical protein